MRDLMNSNWFVSEAICNHKKDKDLVSIDLRRRRNALPLPPPLTTSQEIPTTLLHTPLRAPIVRSHSNIQTFPRHSFQGSSSLVRHSNLPQPFIYAHTGILIPRTSLELTTAIQPKGSSSSIRHHSRRVLYIYTHPAHTPLIGTGCKYI